MNKERPFRILIVEDERPLAQHLEYRIIANSSRYQVVGLAQNGQEALRLMAQHKPDIVFTDIQMPVMNGYDAARAIKALPSPLCDVPIIAMTANAFAEDRQAAMEAGMNDHIAKPIKVDVLFDTLRKIIQGAN